MQKRPHIFRRKYLLRGSIQSRLIFRTALLLLIAIIISASIFYILASRDLENEYYKAHMTLKNTMDLLLPWLLGANFVAIILAILYGILPSHKVAGPIFHLERELLSIEKGRFPSSIKVRKSDDLGDFADKMNTAMNSVKNRVSIVRKDLQDLEDFITTKDNPENFTNDTIEELKNMIHRSLDDIGYFKLK
jgi:signal transduction histidine kinase